MWYQSLIECVVNMIALKMNFLLLQIVSQVGRKNNCTFCGVFRRQALDRGALLLGVNKIVTGSFSEKIKNLSDQVWGF